MSNMTLSEYQQFVSDTSSDAMKGTGQMEILWSVAGLVAEAGEVSGECEKALRKHGVLLPDAEDRIFDELSDTLYFLVAVCNALDVPLHSLIDHNSEKVSKRVQEGYYKN